MFKMSWGKRKKTTKKDSVQFSRSVVSNSLRPHEPQHARPPCPSPTPRVHPNPCPLSLWCHPTISSSVVPFSSCPQSFPGSWSFQMSQLFASGGQSIGVSASTSVLPILVKPHAPSLPSLSQDLPLVPSSSSLYITWWWWWFSHTKLCPSLAIPWTVAWQDPLPWDFPGKNTRGGCHFLLQGIFLTQRLNLGLLHCSQILYRWASREDLISPTPSL